jgi:small-conductance mechanosensitive channel
MDMAQIIEWLTQHNINVMTIFATVAVLVLASIVILILSRLLRQWLTYLRPHVHLTYESSLTISRVFTAVLWVVTIFIVLNIWGVGLGGVWAILVSAITVIGVGFLATWTMISNFTANFFLLLWRPFHFGQTVELLPENLKGRVTDRNLMFTTLCEDSGSMLQIPNNLFFQKMFRVSGDAAIAAADLRERGDAIPPVPGNGPRQ